MPISNLQLNCKFDNGSLCDWIQEKYKDEVDFVINVGPTLCQKYYSNTGPINDPSSSSKSIVRVKYCFFFN